MQDHLSSGNPLQPVHYQPDHRWEVALTCWDMPWVNVHGFERGEQQLTRTGIIAASKRKRLSMKNHIDLPVRTQHHNGDAKLLKELINAISSVVRSTINKHYGVSPPVGPLIAQFRNQSLDEYAEGGLIIV